MKDKRLTIIIIALAVLIALLITGLVLFLVLREDAEPQNDRPHGGIVYDPDAGEYDPDNPMYNGGSSSGNGISIPGFGTWTIPPNVTNVVTDFFNPSVNEGKYDMTFEVWIPEDINDLDKGYEVIYTSGLVRAGDHIQNVTLSRSFEKGTYDAILHVQPYSADEYQTKLNNANVKFTLIVK